MRCIIPENIMTKGHKAADFALKFINEGNENALNIALNQFDTDKTPMSDKDYEVFLQNIFVRCWDPEWVFNLKIDPKFVKRIKERNFLRFAVERGDKEFIQYLLSRGADKKALDKEGRPALFYACRKIEDLETLKLFEFEGCYDSYDEDYLFEAVRFNRNPEIVKYLLKDDIYIDITDSMGNTPLMLAAKDQTNLAVIQTLIDAGAKIDAINDNGENCLHFALSNKSQDIVRFFLKKIPLSETNRYGFSVLDVAFNKKIPFENLCLVLKKEKEDLIKAAILQESSELLENLLEKDSSIANFKFLDGSYPLLFAAENSDEFRVGLLLQHGAVRDVEDSEGKNVVHCFASNAAGKIQFWNFIVANDLKRLASRKDKEGHLPEFYMGQKEFAI